MTVQLIEPNQTIEVKQICLLGYGQPGSRKSSLAQTSEEPVTLAFDPGIYRAYGRKTAAIFETWSDVLDFDYKPYRTIIVDTIGMALDKLSAAIIADNPKNGNRLGGLSLPGYGILKSWFAAWVADIRQRGQDLVFLAHEKAERLGDDVYYCPDVVGGSYNTLMNHCDVVGYLHFEAGRRVIDFNPTDRWMAKVPPCGWGQINLPDFGTEPRFLAKLLAEAKASMGRISAESAELVQAVENFRAWLEKKPSLEAFNTGIKDVKTLANGAQKQAWHLCKNFAESQGWVFDPQAKAFRAKEQAA